MRMQSASVASRLSRKCNHCFADFPRRSFEVKIAGFDAPIERKRERERERFFQTSKNVRNVCSFSSSTSKNETVAKRGSKFHKAEWLRRRLFSVSFPSIPLGNIPRDAGELVFVDSRALQKTSPALFSPRSCYERGMRYARIDCGSIKHVASNRSCVHVDIALFPQIA